MIGSFEFLSIAHVRKSKPPDNQTLGNRRSKGPVYMTPSSDQSPFWARSRTSRPLSVRSGLPSLPVTCLKNTGCHVSLLASR